MDDPSRKWSMAKQQHMEFIYVCICVCTYKCTWLHVYMHTDTCAHISTQYQHILLFSKKHPAPSLAENVPSLWLIPAFIFDLCGLPKARSAVKGENKGKQAGNLLIYAEKEVWCHCLSSWEHHNCPEQPAVCPAPQMCSRLRPCPSSFGVWWLLCTAHCLPDETAADRNKIPQGDQFMPCPISCSCRYLTYLAVWLLSSIMCNVHASIASLSQYESLMEEICWTPGRWFSLSHVSAYMLGREENPQLLLFPDYKAELWVSIVILSHWPEHIHLKQEVEMVTTFLLLVLSLTEMESDPDHPMLFSSTFPPSHFFKSEWPFGRSSSSDI